MGYLISIFEKRNYHHSLVKAILFIFLLPGSQMNSCISAYMSTTPTVCLSPPPLPVGAGTYWEPFFCAVYLHISPPSLLPRSLSWEQVVPVLQGSELEADTTACSTSFCGLSHLTHVNAESRARSLPEVSLYGNLEKPQDGGEVLTVSSTSIHGHF